MTQDCSDIDNAWKFWEPLITKEGEIDIEQLKKELTDYYFIMHEVPKVYCAVTGNLLSKLMYPAESVIEAFEDYLRRCIDETLEEYAGETLCKCHKPPTPMSNHVEDPNAR